MHARPETRNERVPVLGILQRNFGAETHWLVSLHASDGDFASLVASLRQITAEENLLRARGQVRQLAGIDPSGLQTTELDLEIAQRRLGDFTKQLQRDG